MHISINTLLTTLLGIAGSISTSGIGYLQKEKLHLCRSPFNSNQSKKIKGIIQKIYQMSQFYTFFFWILHFLSSIWIGFQCFGCIWVSLDGSSLCNTSPLSWSASANLLKCRKKSPTTSSYSFSCHKQTKMNGFWQEPHCLWTRKTRTTKKI